MSLLRIAWRSILQRSLSSLLTSVSMALGVTLVVAVLIVYATVSTSFRQAAQGYNLVVGGKGSATGLVLSTVYFLGTPIEPIPWSYYERFVPEERRLMKSAQRTWGRDGQQVQGAFVSYNLDAKTISLRSNTDTPAEIAIDRLSDEDRAWIKEYLKKDFSRDVDVAIPYCLGDNYLGYRVVGTTNELFTKLGTGVDDDDRPIPYYFAAGRNFNKTRPFEAVIGSEVARATGLGVNSKFAPEHGLTAADPDEKPHVHDPFTVVGVLSPTGTPNDRALFVNIEGFFMIEDHAKPLDEAMEREQALGLGTGDDEAAHAHDDHDHDHDHGHDHAHHHHHDPLPPEQREVTAILVRTKMDNPGASIAMPVRINEGAVATAASPVSEIDGLFGVFVDPIQWLLLGLTALICVVAGIGIMVSIYNSMSERRREIAIMRALGARRQQIVRVILYESILLSVAGGLFGILLGHLLIFFLNPVIASYSGVSIGLLQWGTIRIESSPWGAFDIVGELVLVPALVLLASLVGMLPAMAAYRTDVSRSLSS